MPITFFGVTPEQIWSYAKRELTQAKFPFWSAIITPVAGSVSIPGASSTRIDVQPPPGETWLIFLAHYIAYLTANANFITSLYDYDGTTERLHSERRVYNYYAILTSDFQHIIVITNTSYMRFGFYNALSSAVTGYYGYSGFKLSKPHWTPNRSSDPLRPWKRPTTQPLPSQISALQKYACEIFSHEKNDYELCIMLEEDTILAVDPNTNFPVERLTAYARVEDFMNILKLRDNPLERPENQRSLSKLEYLKAIGWLKYFEKWAKEGITI